MSRCPSIRPRGRVDARAADHGRLRCQRLQGDGNGLRQERRPHLKFTYRNLRTETYSPVPMVRVISLAHPLSLPSRSAARGSAFKALAARGPNRRFLAAARNERVGVVLPNAVTHATNFGDGTVGVLIKLRSGL